MENTPAHDMWGVMIGKTGKQQSFTHRTDSIPHPITLEEIEANRDP